MNEDLVAGMTGGQIEEVTIDVDGVEVFCRCRGGDGVPVVFVHGNPTHSEDWVPFLERLEGPALAFDLPAFGRSERPADFDSSMDGYGRFVERFLDVAGVGEYSLVVHDWGAVGLIAAQRAPERLRRLVVINSVPLMPGYRWHWVARIWRTPVLGELFNATSTKAATALALRQATGDRRAMPAEFVDMIWRHLDAGTKRAVLKLYRSADPDRLAAAGAHLGDIQAPTLVVWGERDPYLPPKFGHRYAEAFPNARHLPIPGAGHWPWIDRPDTIDHIVEFLSEPA